ncbi:hypothetical protein DMB66_59780, partial [Actinoplanes sp. ATCC 53533]
MGKNDFFQLFCLSESLKSYDLSIDEIQDASVDGGNDGGIDALFTFIDGDPLTDDYRPRPRKEVVVELLIVQCKDTESFSGTAIDKLISTVSTLFDYSRSVEDLSKTYNEKLTRKAGGFRRFHQQNITRISKLAVRFYYFSRSEHVFETLREPVATLEGAAARLFPNSSVEFNFVGASELLEYSRTDRTKKLELAVREGPIAVSEAGFIALVSLSDYFKFVTDENQNRRRHLFLSNVRDYEGSVEVNRAIEATLRGEAPEDFWVLNNGVTILAVAARPGFKSLVLEDPVIVNGLQTTMEIIQHFRRSPGVDDRMLLLRIVIPQNDKSRDRVIVATIVLSRR